MVTEELRSGEVTFFQYMHLVISVLSFFGWNLFKHMY